MGGPARKTKHFDRHEPTDDEVLAALRAPQSAAYWQSLAPHHMSTEVAAQVAEALSDGGFMRVDPTQLTKRITDDPCFKNSVWAGVPAAHVPLSVAGHPGFYAVHCRPGESTLSVQFGFLEQLGAMGYFRQPAGQVFTNIKDPNGSWPGCDYTIHRPPVRASIFWKR
jgi:hypothetical protein